MGIKGNVVKFQRVGREPQLSSEGGELTVGAGKDAGRSQGPSWFPMRSELILHPCLIISPSFCIIPLSPNSEVWSGGKRLPASHGSGQGTTLPGLSLPPAGLVLTGGCQVVTHGVQRGPEGGQGLGLCQGLQSCFGLCWVFTLGQRIKQLRLGLGVGVGLGKNPISKIFFAFQSLFNSPHDQKITPPT